MSEQEGGKLVITQWLQMLGKKKNLLNEIMSRISSSPFVKLTIAKSAVQQGEER